MSQANRRDRIPVKLVVPYVQDWAKRCDEGSPPADVLAMRTGAHRTVFERLIAGRYRGDHISFDIADRLFCAMGNPVAYWHAVGEDLYVRACKGADAIEAMRGTTESEKAAERSRWKKAEAAV